MSASIEQQLNYAQIMQGTVTDPMQQEYWTGYLRGLRRAYYGERYGTDAEHEQWLTLKGDPDGSRDMRGRGYRRGFRAGIGCTREQVSDCEECTLVSYGRDCRNMPLYGTMKEYK